ncbi:hypothetical protein FOL47_003724 [Perkinsus chesapeaki]|uniref:EGF-like domain-containing protein n=1 Tax=Perkinsus chesapeaki TaxID=330153 RepID=A0A7J6M6B8_PERCH|nr:hypothetical protein FOL47_003724 [Perkinsus chesapeaki]
MGSCADTCAAGLSREGNLCVRPQKVDTSVSVYNVEVLQQYSAEWCQDSAEMKRSFADLQLRLAVAFGIPVEEVKAAVQLVDGNPKRFQEDPPWGSFIQVHWQATDTSNGNERRMRALGRATIPVNSLRKSILPKMSLRDNWGCAITPTMELKCWGTRNEYGQLRYGSVGSSVIAHASSIKAVDIGRKPGVDDVTGNASFASVLGSYCPTGARYGTEYSSLTQATDECTDDLNCGGVYDLDCDGAGSFHKCRLGSVVEGATTASCVHMKGYSSRMGLAPCVNCEQCGVQRARMSGVTGYGCLDACLESPSCGAVSIRMSDGACFSTSSTDFVTCTTVRSGYIAFYKVTSPGSSRVVKSILSPTTECTGTVNDASDDDVTTAWAVGATVGSHCVAAVDLGKPALVSEVSLLISASDVAASVFHVTLCPSESRCSSGRTVSCPVSGHSLVQWQGASMAVLTCSLGAANQLAFRHLEFKLPTGIHVFNLSLRVLEASQPLSVTSVSAGVDHLCVTVDGIGAVKGGLKCWGLADDLQAGGPVGEEWSKSLGGTGEQLPIIETNVEQVVTGRVTDCILIEHKVKCWGSNKDGALGLGMSYLSRGFEDALFVNLGTSDLPVKQIAGAYYHFCAVVDGYGTTGRDILKCWGFNNYGQLGYGDVLSRGRHISHMGDNLPAALMPSQHIADICTGLTFTCVLGHDGALQCAGYVPGVFDSAIYQTLTQFPANDVSHMCCGRDFVCFIHGDDQLTCAGGNTNGQLGAASLSSGAHLLTSTLTTGTVPAELTCGESNACLTDASGTVVCWGDTGEGRAALGTGSVGTERPVEIDTASADGGFFLTTQETFNRVWRAVGACSVLWYSDDGCMDELEPSYRTPPAACISYSIAVFSSLATVRCFRVLGDGPSSGWVSVDRFDGLKFTTVHDVLVNLPVDSFRANPLPNRVANYGNLCDPEGSGWSSVECSSGTCHHGQCVCYRGYQGADCSSLNIRTPVTPTPTNTTDGGGTGSDGCSGSDVACGDYGTCQSSGDTVTCLCSEGVIGADCERQCGTDPYTHRHCLEAAGSPIDVTSARPGSPVNVSACVCEEDWTYRGARCSTRSNRGCCKFTEGSSDREWCKCKGAAVWHDDFFPADTWQFCGIGWKCWPNSGVSGNDHQSRTLPSLEECKLFCLSFGACENIEYDSRTGLCNLSVMKKEVTGWNNGDESDFMLCEPTSDLCHTVDCGLHGRCSVMDAQTGKLGCQCTDGYSGAWCESPPPSDPCQSRQCPEHSTCSVSSTTGTIGLSLEDWILAATECTCDLGWTDGSTSQTACSHHLSLDVTLVVGIPVVSDITQMAAAITLLRSISLSMSSTAPFLRLELRDVDAITGGPILVTLTLLAPPDDSYYSEEIAYSLRDYLADSASFLRTESLLSNITQPTGRFTLDMVSAVPVVTARASTLTKHVLLNIAVTTQRLSVGEMSLIVRTRGGISAILGTPSTRTVIKEHYSTKPPGSAPQFINFKDNVPSTTQLVVSGVDIGVAPAWWEARQQQENLTTTSPAPVSGGSSMLIILASAISGVVVLIAAVGLWLWRRHRAKHLASIAAEEDPIGYARGSTVRSKPQLTPSDLSESGKPSTPITPEATGRTDSPFDNTASTDYDPIGSSFSSSKYRNTVHGETFSRPAHHRNGGRKTVHDRRPSRLKAPSLGGSRWVRHHSEVLGSSRPEKRKSHMWSFDGGTGDLAIPDRINPKRRPSLIAPGRDPIHEVEADILEWTQCHIDSVDVDTRRKAFRQLQALWHPDKFDDDPTRAAVTVVFQYQEQLAEIAAANSTLVSDKERLAILLEPYMDEEGKMRLPDGASSIDPNIKILKEGLDLRLQEFWDSFQRLQQIERRLSRKIDETAMEYQHAISDVSGLCDKRILKRLREQQRQITLQQVENDQLRFERDTLNYELQRLRQLLLRDPNFNGAMDNATLFQDHRRAVREQEQDLRDQMRTQMPPLYRSNGQREGDEAAGGRPSEATGVRYSVGSASMLPSDQEQHDGQQSSFDALMSYIGLGSGGAPGAPVRRVSQFL